MLGLLLASAWFYVRNTQRGLKASPGHCPRVKASTCAFLCRTSSQSKSVPMRPFTHSNWTKINITTSLSQTLVSKVQRLSPHLIWVRKIDKNIKTHQGLLNKDNVWSIEMKISGIHSPDGCHQKAVCQEEHLHMPALFLYQPLNLLVASKEGGLWADPVWKF